MNDRRGNSFPAIIANLLIVAASLFAIVLAIAGLLAGDDTLLLFAVFLILAVILTDSMTRDR